MDDKKREIHKVFESFIKDYHQNFMQKPIYKEGDRISYAGRVFDETEMINLGESLLEFWLTAGRWSDLFEQKLGDFLGVKFCSLVNSGSSANLLAFLALTSPLLEKRAVKKGDEIITVAAGFPTTIAPIIQFGAVPVFVDITIPQYNIDVQSLKKALSPKTKAVFIAHTLGNPFDLKAVKDFCDENNLWLIEDNCDSLGSKYEIDGVEKQTGTIGDIGTSSFYPPHHITMGEGGAVYTSNVLLDKIVRSFRDWGRDCACPPGKDNLCGHRFDKQYGQLPLGYDHKYVYSHFGYNLKATDMQAAIGCAQIDKLPSFIEKRRANWDVLNEGLKELEEHLILPQAAPNSRPSWFGFMITCKGISRKELTGYIESQNVQTRLLFAGNIIRQPCFDAIREDKTAYRIAGDLLNTDRVMNDSFWIGCYPGMNRRMLETMIKVIKDGVYKLSR